MRSAVKRGLALLPDSRPANGASVLIYHRVGGKSGDERDVSIKHFREHLDVLDEHDVVPLDVALGCLERGDSDPRVVLTFDDGFADVYANAWPLLRARQLPFTVYVCSAYVGATMHWDGSTAKDRGGPALSWAQLAEMVATGLCTVGNHTHTHARPAQLTEDELDVCTNELRDHLGVVPRHFAYTWGVFVPEMRQALSQRFVSAATGELGRNLAGADHLRLARIPVRGSDPAAFFAAKLSGQLVPERVYASIVSVAKRMGARA